MAGCAANSGVVPIGDDTFMVSRQAATGFSGLGTLKADALQEASHYCASRNLQSHVISAVEAEPPFILGNFPKADVTFKCVDIGANGSEENMASAQQDAPDEGRLDTYAELEVLNDLHERGVLTDDEFAEEKKKLLEAD
jgi:hypothetical protein